MKTFIKFRIPLRASVFAVVMIGLTFIGACKKEFNEPVNGVNEEAMSAARAGVPVTRYPLFIPSVITTSSFNLTAEAGTHNLGGGATTNVWEYNGSFPGPTIVATKGDIISATYQNNIPEPSIIHWHGMLVNHDNDGQPMQVIPTGASYSY